MNHRSAEGEPDAATTANKSDVERIARALVEGRLAAFVQNSGPSASTYQWQDAIETSEKWLHTIKNTETNYDRVEAT
jgi:uncharacterized protein involved in tolerance to divalent cations